MMLSNLCNVIVIVTVILYVVGGAVGGDGGLV